MHDIEMHEASVDFARCWQAAGRHLQTRAKGTPLIWLKSININLNGNLDPLFRLRCQRRHFDGVNW